MIVTIGSKNPNKVQAVCEAFSMFTRFSGARFESASVTSGVSDQPIGFEETLRGAKERARNAFIKCDLSVGLESGLIPVPLTRSGYMNLSVCAIYNGNEHFLGLGPAFELPESITRLVVDDKLELDDAIFKSGFSSNPRIGYSEGIIGILPIFKSGFSSNPRIGYSEGIIGILTNGAITRKDYMVPAVSMAMAGLLHCMGNA